MSTWQWLWQVLPTQDEPVPQGPQATVKRNPLQEKTLIQVKNHKVEVRKQSQDPNTAPSRSLQTKCGNPTQNTSINNTDPLILPKRGGGPVPRPLASFRNICISAFLCFEHFLCKLNCNPLHIQAILSGLRQPG